LKSVKTNENDMRKFQLNDSIVIAVQKNKKSTSELSLFSGDETIGQMHYHVDSDNLAGAILENNVWIFERIGKGYYTSLITVKNVYQNNPHFKIYVDLKGTTTGLELSNGGKASFRNVCFWKNRWAWVDTETNEEIIDFNIKLSSSRRGVSNISPNYLNDRKVPIMCLLGWFILHSMDINEKKNQDIIQSMNF